MLKQILCYSLLVGQVFAVEQRPVFPSDEMRGIGFMSEVPESWDWAQDPLSPFANALDVTEVTDVTMDNMLADLVPVAPAKTVSLPIQMPVFPVVQHKKRSPNFKVAEDDIILQFVRDHGGMKRQNSEECEKILAASGASKPGVHRTAEQICCRYYKYLIKRKEFTEEEDQRILWFVKKTGKNWKFISKSFEGCTWVQIKNRYKYLINQHKG